MAVDHGILWSLLIVCVTRVYTHCVNVADCAVPDQHGNRQRHHHQIKGSSASKGIRQEIPRLHSGNIYNRIVYFAKGEPRNVEYCKVF